jgi:hypothetical protein
VSRAMHRALRPAAIIAVVAAFAAACTDVSTAPDAVFSLEFSSLPYPAVVAGDTLRDSTGAAAPLRAIAYNARGDAIAQAPITYIVVADTAGLIQVDATTGVVTAAAGKTGTVEVVASAAGLQSERRQLAVVNRPDSVSITATPDTVFYSYVDATQNISDPLAVRVLHEPPAGAATGVRGWVVRYRLENVADTVIAALLGDQNTTISGDPRGRMHIDTTSADGTASRKLRILAGATLRLPVDSVVVMADVLHRGVHVRGSPVRFVVFAAPRSAP